LHAITGIVEQSVFEHAGRFNVFDEATSNGFHQHPSARHGICLLNWLWMRELDTRPQGLPLLMAYF
jgi:hypothetical protein